MWKNNKSAVLAALLLAGAAGCADLGVDNLNAPDKGRALGTASDVQALVGGAFGQWWIGQARYGGPSFLLSAMSFQHSAWPANAGVYFYGALPRPQIQNNQVHPEYGNAVLHAWSQNYKALAAVAAGLRAIDTDPQIAAELGGDEVLMTRAFGKFVQGIAHASIAVLYDKGFLVDEAIETIDQSGNPTDLGEPVPYTQMITAALAYLDEAISLAGSADFDIPKGWMGVDVSSADLVRIAHSMKARFRAAVARTPAERADIAWVEVLADIQAGITEDFTLVINGDDYSTPWTNDIVNYLASEGWQQLTYMVLGMADQSDAYQRWLAKPVTERTPDIDGAPTLIVTPDTRFAQGATLDEQRCQPGSIYEVPEHDCDNDGKLDNDAFTLQGNNWSRPDRGTWRWSYYWNRVLINDYYGDAIAWPEITMDEMNLLAAEAHYRMGDYPEAANLINLTRVDAALTPAVGTVDGGNVSCVPKLPDGVCGDLWEMLKWEKRLEVRFSGLYGAPWYFDGRGWGDLYVGTPLQFPMPSRELQGLGLAVYTFGGAGGESAAPPSVYAWPHEQ